MLGPNTAVVVSDTVRARKTLSTRSNENVVMQLKKGQVLTDIQAGYMFDSGQPAIYGKIHGTRHPYVYVAVGTPGEEKQNGDGSSWFVAFRYNEIPGFIIASNSPLNSCASRV